MHVHVCTVLPNEGSVHYTYIINDHSSTVFTYICTLISTFKNWCFHLSKFLIINLFA